MLDLFLSSAVQDESKVKVGINYGKSFLKVSPKTTVDYCNDFELHQSSPLGSPFKFSGAKRVLRLGPETHLNCLEIVYLENINEIVDYIFTGGLEMPNLMMALTQVLTRAPTTFLHSSHGIPTLLSDL